MDAAEFKRGIETLWGPRWRDWSPKAAEAFDVNPSTLVRWISGAAEIPGPAGRLMEHLLQAEPRRLAARGHERAYRQRKRAAP